MYPFSISYHLQDLHVKSVKADTLYYTVTVIYVFLINIYLLILKQQSTVHICNKYLTLSFSTAKASVLFSLVGQVWKV